MANKFNLLKKTQLGDGLLSEVSKELKESEETSDIVKLSIDLLDNNDNNQNMSLDDIDELAESILENGLDHNLVVIPSTNGRYKILAGHRRKIACAKLVKEGHEEYRFLPCKIKKLSDINLNISDEAKEKWALLNTNIQVRNNTLEDKLEIMRLADEVFSEMKENGVATESRRTWLANSMGVSESTVRDLTYIENNKTEELEQAISNNMSLTVASAIAHLDPEDQKELLNKNEDAADLSVSHVTEFKKEKNEEKKKAALSNDTYLFSSNEIENLWHSLEKSVPESVVKEGSVVLKQTEYKKVLAAQEAIQKNLSKIYKVLEQADLRTKK